MPARGERGLPTRADPMPEAASALVCSAGEWPAGDAVPESRFAARHVFVTSKSTRPAAMSAQHTYCVTVTAPSRKYNIFNCYGVFSRDTLLHESSPLQQLPKLRLGAQRIKHRVHVKEHITHV